MPTIVAGSPLARNGARSTHADTINGGAGRAEGPQRGEVARIIVIGSAAQDDVVWLREPLGPGRHLEAGHRALRFGGGGANTAIPLHRAGHQVVLAAPVGQDAVGDWLVAQLVAAGLSSAALARVPGESTRSLVLIDPEGERTIVNLHRCREAHVSDRLRGAEADAIYIRSRELEIGHWLAARAAETLVVAHVPPLAAGSRPATVLVGSESDLPPAFLADPWSAGRAVAGEALRWVVVTRGADGAEAFGACQHLSAPAPAVDVVDTTGAGDVFAAGLVHALVLGRPMDDALRAAVAWGAATVRCAELPSEEAIRELA